MERLKQLPMIDQVLSCYRRVSAWHVVDSRVVVNICLACSVQISMRHLLSAIAEVAFDP